MADDLRYALRLLRRSPGFATAAVFTVALGIGANTAIYSVLQAVWIDAVPFRDPGRLVVVSSLFERGPRPVSDDDYADWRRENAVFEEMGAFGGRAALVQPPGSPATFYAQRVSASLFAVLGARMPHGRPLVEETSARMRRSSLSSATASGSGISEGIGTCWGARYQSRRRAQRSWASPHQTSGCRAASQSGGSRGVLRKCEGRAAHAISSSWHG